jgi:hypothetical protein
VPNKASGAIRELAQGYGPEIIESLAALAGLGGSAGAETDTTRVLAMRELLDRGYGKATQPIGGEEGKPLILEVRWAPAAIVSEATNAIAQSVIDAGGDDVVWQDAEC